MKRRSKTEFNVGEKFRILIPKQTPAGGFSFKVIGKLTKLQGISYKGTPTIQNAVVLLERSEENKSGVIGELEKHIAMIIIINHILQTNRINRINIKIRKALACANAFCISCIASINDWMSYDIMRMIN